MLMIRRLIRLFSERLDYQCNFTGSLEVHSGLTETLNDLLLKVESGKKGR